VRRREDRGVSRLQLNHSWVLLYVRPTLSRLLLANVSAMRRRLRVAVCCEQTKSESPLAAD
jgi:hypothetical protein